jgi:GGDEF domain-containing protein
MTRAPLQEAPPRGRAVPIPASRVDQAEVARYSQIFRALFFLCSALWLSYIYVTHAAWVWNPLGVLLVTALGGVYIGCMEVIYRLVLRLGDPARMRTFVVVRLVIDSLFITAGVYYSGMGRSPYYLLYLLLCMDSGLYLGRQGSLFVAALCGAEYLAAVFLGPHSYGSALASSFVLIVAPFFLFVALYGGGLAIAEREQRDRARRDGLTGLYNHAAFQEDLRQRFAEDRAASKPLSCVLLDVDRFKAVNDTYGHLFGNRVLHAIALRVAERVRAKVAEMGVVHEGHAVPVTISAGISERLAEDGEDPSLVVGRADVALYAAKRAGRDGALMWRPSLDGAG